MISALLVILLCFYIGILTTAIVGWHQNPTRKYPVSPWTQKISTHQPFVSVIIPFRNEQAHIGSAAAAILDNLNAQFELILVDDHSSDHSYSICENIALKNKKASVVQLSKKMGKKEAIKAGVTLAKGDLILQTDADCQVNKHWISCMSNHYIDDTKLLLGPVKVSQSNQRWNWFNQIEFGFLQAFTAGFANLNKPIMANGANLMYSKHLYWLYQESKIGAEYASGDDQFLLNYVKSEHQAGITYLKHRDAIVSTIFPSKWKDMIAQRARWAKKNTASVGFESIISLMLLSAQFILPLCLLIGTFDKKLITLFWTTILLKTGIELLLAQAFMRFFEIPRIKETLLFAIVYPYFLFNIIILVCKKEHQWKNRSI